MEVEGNCLVDLGGLKCQLVAWSSVELGPEPNA